MVSSLNQSVVSALLAAALAVPGRAWGQSPSRPETVVITSREAGPYRPEAKADLQQVRKQIVERTNTFRKEHKRASLERNEKLDQAAQAFADYMARTGRYGHSADGNAPQERIAKQGYESCMVAENIATRFQTTGFGTDSLAEGLMQGWIESPGHRENLLRPHVTQTGVGIAVAESGVYFAVHLFGRPRSQAVSFEINNRTREAISYQLGENSFELPPNFSRTHTMCLPEQLIVRRGDQQITTVTPADATSYTVVSQQGRISVERSAIVPKESTPMPAPAAPRSPGR